MTRSETGLLSRVVCALALALLLCGVVFLPAPALAANPSPSVQADLAWGQMPLYFIANQGQIDGPVSYYVQGSDKTLYFTPDGLTLSMSAPAPAADVGAAPGAPGGAALRAA
jgi:hypothetical protein